VESPLRPLVAKRGKAASWRGLFFMGQRWKQTGCAARWAKASCRSGSGAQRRSTRHALSRTGVTRHGSQEAPPRAEAVVGAAAPTATRSSRRGGGHVRKQQRWSAAPSGTAGRTNRGGGGHGRERQRWSAPPRRQQRAVVVVGAGAATSGSVGQRRRADRIALQP